MKLAIIGSRSFKDYKAMKKVLIKYKIEEIVSGGAEGADTLAERFADEYGIKKKIFKPNYARYKRGALLMRNREVVNYVDRIIAFWDGKSKGTSHAINYARERGKWIDVIHS